MTFTAELNITLTTELNMTLTAESNMTLITESDTKLEMKLCHLNEKGGRTRTRELKCPERGIQETSPDGYHQT